MAMERKYKKRLLKLAEHLEKGKLIHRKFAFSVWNVMRAKLKPKRGAPKGCGTAGCAVGELPGLFPRQWLFEESTNWITGSVCTLPALKDSSGDPMRDAADFFALSYVEARHLFAPDAQDSVVYGGKRLSDRATPKQVAANIRAFIKRDEEGTRGIDITQPSSPAVEATA